MSFSGKVADHAPARIFPWKGWAIACLLSAAACGQPSPGPLIEHITDFWRLPDRDREQPQNVRFEVTVRYHDPFWKLLWMESDGRISFSPYGGDGTVIAPGRRLRIEGTMTPAIGLSFDKVRVMMLPETEVEEPALVPRRELPGSSANESQVVLLEGYFNRQTEVDSNHLLVEMTVGGQVVYVRILLTGSEKVPQMENALVRAKGVIVPTFDPSGRLTTWALWVARVSDLEILGWLREDPRFDRPSLAVEKLGTVLETDLAKVTGVVVSQEPGRSLLLRDSSGQVEILGGQTYPIATGESVEAVGLPHREGVKWQLRGGLYRRSPGASGAAAAQEGLPKLRLVEQVLGLGTGQAARGYPVQLYGVVTWANPPGTPFFFLQDSSGGICVTIDPRTQKVPAHGDGITVVGVTTAGGYAPTVAASSLAVRGVLDIPKASRVTLEQALTGIEEGQWVELDGYLRQVSTESPWTRLDLTTAAGEFSAALPWNKDLAALQGSMVRLRGVCAAIANERRQLMGVRLWVPSPDFVRVEEPALEDPFSVPVQSIGSLRQYTALRVLSRRTRINGVVLLHSPGRYLYVEDRGGTIQVLSQGTDALLPGDRVDAVGFLGHEGSRVVLRESVYRRLGASVEPAPMELAVPAVIDAGFDGHLVKVAGTLLDVDIRQGDSRFVIQSGSAVFEARLEQPNVPAGSGQWEPGCRLALTGVYRIEYDEYRRLRTFHVQLRTKRDIAVLKRPPMWTSKRALATVSALVVVLLLGVVWVVTLRRRVRRQTEQIRAQLSREAQLEAELQRSSRLESLGVLAGGIAHDFNNLLTVIMGNITLARIDGGESSEGEHWLRDAEQGVVRARDLTLQLLTFAKGGDPVRKTAEMSELVREAAEFALHGAKVRCEYDFEKSLWPVEVDKGQIGRVVHNIIINAIQSMPEGGSIRIGLCNATVAAEALGDLPAGRYLKLSIADTGAGIPPEHLSKIFDPYFTTKQQGTGLGLATVYSIVRKHLGRVEVQSRVGEGTVFSIWLPAAEKKAEVRPPSTSPIPQGGGRVLVMDDEEAIRRTCIALLRYMKLEVTAVPDGQAALREYAAARDAGRPYSLVILDLTVPGGMGGRAAMEQLRQMDPSVRAIVSSGYSSDPVVSQYRAYGFAAVVPKPYTLPELEKVVRAVLGGALP